MALAVLAACGDSQGGPEDGHEQPAGRAQPAEHAKAAVPGPASSDRARSDDREQGWVSFETRQPTSPAHPPERAEGEPQTGGDPSLPGIERPDRALDMRLRRATRRLGPAHRPHTRHTSAAGAPRFTNRLVLARSPYLLRHAHSPINWLPFGGMALAKARRENKPILLSIGYSTCHYCHVMQRESFDNLAIARVVNRRYVAIKVDREERPDVDAVYLRMVEMLTGRGGWPLTVLLLPDGRPIFGGTYVPPDSEARDGKGFRSLLEEMAQRFSEDPARLGALAGDISRRLAEAMRPPAAVGMPSPATLVHAAGTLSRHFDPTHGGFGRAPMLPRPTVLAFLMRYHRRTGDPAALRMVDLTLREMARGGIHDQLGGGFHRYAEGPGWDVPHFEKMLHDNALLAVVYLEAYQVTGEELYATVASQTLQYLDHALGSPGGAFHSATDAESGARRPTEGLFYTWTRDELTRAIGGERARRAASYYGLDGEGPLDGRHVLRAPRDVQSVAESLGLTEQSLSLDMERTRRDLLRVRRERSPPRRDEQVITADNALAISAFARAGWVLDRPELVARADRAARYVLTHLRDGRGQLHRSLGPGGPTQAGFLDDYAFLIAALLDLHQASGDLRWLTEALGLQVTQDLLFEDREGGAYFLAGAERESLLPRHKPVFERATPSGNAVSAYNLLRLSLLTGDSARRRKAERVLATFAHALRRDGAEAPTMLAALDFSLHEARQAILIAPSADRGATLLPAMRRTFSPTSVLLVVPELDVPRQTELLPILADKVAIAGSATAYVCDQGRCELPATTPDVLTSQLLRAAPLASEARFAPLEVREPPRARRTAVP